MTPQEIKDRLKDIITNHIRSAEDPTAGDALTKDLHDVLTAKMREKVLGPTEQPAEVTVDDQDADPEKDDTVTNDDETKE